MTCCARCGDYTSEDRLAETPIGLCCLQCVSEDPDALGTDMQDADYGVEDE